MNKEQSIELRKKVQMYARQGMKKCVIAKALGVSRKFVTRWTSSSNLEEDNRGWEKGRKRKYTDEHERLVVKKRKELADKFFLEA